ncbi:antifreeze protein [Jannaschia sp. M317]|uniref:antifreeze protein n=1 Tax=Jannaschia sp. M317 TaxID=2867011 RepID=UPI0021A7433D|nr:antifreeze protein [Jannaschia sp. M317]UWQ16946.1 antifreeze protein [Jannaschia sp. M317]
MLELLKLQMRTAHMLTEAQTVIGMRMLGWMGVTPAAKGENARMVTEKQTAFAKAGMAATLALWSGKTPAQAYGLALAPIGRTTHSNAQRLTRRRARG